MPRSRSPARRAPRRAASSTGAGSLAKVSSSGKALLQSGASCLQSPTMAVAKYTGSACLLGGLLLGASLKYGLISRFVSPLIGRLYLAPLGLQLAKARGVILCGVAWYAMATYIALPLICNLAVPLCCGTAPSMGAPRTPRTGCCGRLAAAQLNMVEGFVLLLAALFSALAAGLSDELVAEAVVFYALVRKLYVVAYAADMPLMRSSCYMAGAMCMLRIICLAILKSK